MRKIFWIILVLALIITTIIAIVLFLLNKKTGEVCFPSYCFNVEISKTTEDQEKGLMFRKTLSQNEGMLFVFPAEENYSFWMKNTLIPLDIIWINQNKEVVFISENNQPCREESCSLIMPDKKAKYVLEINAGLSKEVEISIGSKMEFK